MEWATNRLAKIFIQQDCKKTDLVWSIESKRIYYQMN
jgi:hypothetical protein